MFQFPGFAPIKGYSIRSGLPHSEIHGSKLIRSSPWLIAAYHVLHRLCMPRHSPDALKTLDRSHRQCPSRSRAKTQNRERTNIRAFLGHRKHETACNSSSRPAAVSSQHERPYKKHPCRQKDQLPETEPNDGGQAHQSRRITYLSPDIQPPQEHPCRPEGR